MTTNLNFFKGGFVDEYPLPPRAREQIARRLPLVSIERVSAATGWYLVERDANRSNPPPSPKEARQSIRALKKDVLLLSAAVAAVAHGPLRSIVNQPLLPTIKLNDRTGEGPPTDVLGNLRDALSWTMMALELADRRIPKGRPKSAHHRLVETFATIIRDAGLPLTAAPGGPLVMLLQIVLESVGEEASASNAVKIVGDCFGKRRSADKSV